MLICILIVFIEFNWSWPSYSSKAKGLSQRSGMNGVILFQLLKVTAVYVCSLKICFGPTWNSNTSVSHPSDFSTLPLSGPFSISPSLYFEFLSQNETWQLGRPWEVILLGEKLGLSQASWLPVNITDTHSSPGLRWEDGNWVWPNIIPWLRLQQLVISFKQVIRLCVFMICSAWGILSSMCFPVFKK